MRRTRIVIAGLVLALTAAGCGSSDEPSSSGAEPGTTDTTAEVGAFPVRIDHAYGTTEIDEAPERVVTWGWGSTEAALALDVAPVAMPFQDYAGDDEGVLPWIREHLEAEDIEVPERLPQTEEEAPVEAIAAARPDVILAPYSGITEDEYDLLSQIAPTVAFPEAAWSTPWRDTIEIVGEALGRTDQAADVLAAIDDQLAEAAAAHPELEGKTVANVWPTRDDFYVYKAADPRVSFLLDLGLEIAPSVEELASGEETFYFTLSQERLGELESDLLVSYADTPDQATEFLEAPAAQVMGQVRDGTVAQITGTEFISAVSPPTALSLPWGLDEYVSVLSAAAEAADAG
jgi:iron complex transport system substrate-binding protein